MLSPSLRCQARRPHSKKVPLACVLPSGLDVEHNVQSLANVCSPIFLQTFSSSNQICFALKTDFKNMFGWPWTMGVFNVKIAADINS